MLFGRALRRLDAPYLLGQVDGSCGEGSSRVGCYVVE